jgi:hypothetical protein
MGESTVTETVRVWLGERTSPDDEQNLIILLNATPDDTRATVAAFGGAQRPTVPRDTWPSRRGLSADHNP